MWSTILGIAGALGGVTGVVALVYAHIAYRAAKSAADATRTLGEEANAISRRAEDREVERHDVKWDGGWVAPGVYRLVKRGSDAAHQVDATVTVDGREERTQRADLITEDGHALEFRFPQTAARFRGDFEKYRRAKEAAAANPYPGAGGQRPFAMDHHAVAERVLWTTALGKPQFHEVTRPTSFSRFNLR